MAAEQALHVPPSFRIEDAHWSRTGEGLVLERRPTLRSVARFLVFTGAFAAFGVLDIVQGSSLTGWLLLALAALGLVALVTIARLRVRITFHPDGSARWERSGPRAGQGRWTARSVTAARITAGRRPARWGAHPTIEAQVEVRGDWVTLAWGFDRPRAEQLVTELCSALGLPEGPAVPTGR